MAGTRSGFNRKTRQELETSGGYRKTRHGDLVSPEPPSGRPAMPAGLDPAGQAEWARMMTRLELSRSLWTVDDAAIYQYCRLFAETERVSDQQTEAEASLVVLEQNIGDVKGPDIVSLFGQIVILRKLISKCTDQLRQGRMALRQYLVEFGLTPASRGRVKIPASQEPVDAFSTFQKARLSRVT